MSYETTSKSLLWRVRDPADEQAWREFESRYSELIRRYCFQRGLTRADLDDVSQMVWSDLAKGLRNFTYDPAKGRFRVYLGRIVRSAISRHFSRYGPATQALDSNVQARLSDDSDAQDECWEKEWADHHYRLAMVTIERTFDERNVSIFRQLVAGEPTERVAAASGMTVGAVNQAKHRIRTRLKELIARQVREEDEPDAYGQV